MKKITLFLFALFSCLSFGQTCKQFFTTDGYDADSTSLSVNASALMCAAGTINSVTITDAYLDDFFGEECGNYYTFELNLDGVVTNVCAEDLIDKDITGFTTLVVTAFDADDYVDYIIIDLGITIDYTLTDVPDCLSLLISPANGSNEAIQGLLKWNAVAGAAGYTVNVGTTSGGNDVLSQLDAGNVTQYNIEGILNFDSSYYVSIVPYNAIGSATGCTEFNFNTPDLIVGSSCESPKVIAALPYTVVDNTADYYDVYEGSPGASGCGTISPYLGGNDVVYSYTASDSGSIKIVLTPTGATDTFLGFFIYGSCSDIGVNCLAGVASAGVAPKAINEFNVIAGATYYFVVSTYPLPQTGSYTLQINENTCENGAATFSVNSLCDGDTAGFEVVATIASLGSAASVTVSDNHGNSVVASVEGEVVLGPYANNTPVIVTVLNNQDGNCSIVSAPLNQLACPPVNDDCLGAVVLDVNTDFDCVSFATGTVLSATASIVAGNSCSGTADDDVWFSFEATNTSHRIHIFDVVASAGSTDMYHSLWTGGCNGLTLVPGSCSDPNISNPNSLVVGQTYYVRVYTYYASTVGQNTTFKICIGTLPEAPINDSCDAAIDVTEFPFTHSLDASGATNNDGFVTGCADFASPMNDGVWYTVMGNGSDIIIEATSFDWDGRLDVYTGSCGAFECEGSEDSVLYDEAEVYTIENSVIGQAYYINFGHYSDDTDEPEGKLTITITSPDLTIDENEFEGFRIYPNPVNHILNLSYTEGITSVQVFNMLGQQVIIQSIYASEGKIDVSDLVAGTYLVRIFTDNQVKTLKVVKD